MMRRTYIVVLMSLLVGMVTAVSAQESNRAGLVVTLEDGTVITRCVEFAEPEISGYELLSRSGLAVETANVALGAAVCRLEGVGCPSDDCFCQCKGSDCIYWSYWHLQDGVWRYSQAGAGLSQVQNGMVDGWTYGPGSPQNAPEPPPLTFDEICAAPEAVSAAVVDAATAVNITGPDNPPDAVTSGRSQWLGYGLLGLLLTGLAGLLLTRGGKER